MTYFVCVTQNKWISIQQLAKHSWCTYKNNATIVYGILKQVQNNFNKQIVVNVRVVNLRLILFAYTHHSCLDIFGTFNYQLTSANITIF